MWNCFKRGKAMAKPRWPLSLVLMDLGDGEVVTLADFLVGTIIFGSIGSGKSSGSYFASLYAMLVHGFGGVILTAKPDDTKRYVNMCRACGRGGDVIVVSDDGKWRLDPFDYEIRNGPRSTLVHNLVAMLLTCMEISERRDSSNGGGDADYFRRAAEQLLTAMVTVLVLAENRLSIPRLYELILALPTSLEQLQSEEWRRNSVCLRILQAAERNCINESQRRDLESVFSYIFQEWTTLADRTRSSILSTVTSMLAKLNSGLIRDVMSGDGTPVEPEMAQLGKIIIIDLAAMVYGVAGILLQVLFKYCFQKAQERRDVETNPRPVFIAVDECQLFAVKQDYLFQTICRSTKTAVLYATQSISNLLATFGSQHEAEVTSLLGNMRTQIFHAQGDIKTLQYVSEMVGRSRQFVINGNLSQPRAQWLDGWFTNQEGQTSGGVSEVFEYEISPSMFTQLRSGGAPHFEVDAIIYRGNGVFRSTGKCWRYVTFRQWTEGQPIKSLRQGETS
jgi:hypothetical protein